jgi:signal transduction histidine kinase
VGRRHASFYLSLIVGVLILGLSVFGFVGLLGRPTIPWAALERATGVTHDAAAADPDFLPGAVVRADGFEVRDDHLDFKFIAAHHRIGDPIEFVVAKDGRELAVTEPLVPFYGKSSAPVIFLLTGVFGFLIGFGVFILRAEDRRARLFFWLCMAFSSAVMISGEWYGVQGRPLHLVPGVLFFFAYTLTPVILLKFVLTFTARERLPGGPLLWVMALLFGGFFSVVIVASLLSPSIALFRLKMYFSVFRIFFGVVCLASIVILFRAFRTAPTRERRDQVRWVLYGMIVGLGPFMFLYTIPLAVGLRPPLSEETASIFFAFLPLALAFAILKYKLLDINVIINRGVVYSLLTMVTVGVYLASIEGLKALFAAGSVTGRPWIPVGSAFIAAIAFAPARSRIQVLVDKAFFRTSYDYRRAVLGFTTAAAKVHGAADLLTLFSATLDEALPVEKVGAFIPAPAVAAPGVALRRGLDYDAVATLFARSGGPDAPLPPEELQRLGFEYVLPVPLGDDGPWGWVFVGPKRSGLKLTDEDQELLRALAAEMSASLRRIRLQEEVIYERASREKLEELGRLKTEFITSVSHELRTPMTSLQAISELLDSGKADETSLRKHLIGLMAGECSRLGRYLHNVLDFGRIEQDAMTYEIRETDLKPVVVGVVEVVRSAAAEDDLDLEIKVPEGPVTVDADPDAVRQALLNLVDNAIKYSSGRKQIVVRLVATAAGGAEISVSDRGLGISAEDRERIFEAFYRAPEAVRHDPKGVGLGLKIVKHIMDAHGGEIDISGAPGRGTTITLKFPGRR